MDTQKLDNWAQHLMDMGSRNNLLNFKDQKKTTVEVVSPDSNKLFNWVLNNNTLEVFEPNSPVIKTRSKKKNELVSPEDEATNGEREESLIERYSKQLKKNQILVQNNVSGLTGADSIREIDKKAKEFLTETGANVAYLSFGFVNWYDGKSRGEIYRAPILLVPVEITRKSNVFPYEIKPYSDDILVNPSFNYKLQEEFKIELPEYTEGKLDDYLTQVAGIVDRINWTVSDEVELGIFSFNKTDMYQDLMENRELVLANPTVQLLLGESPGGEGGAGETVLPEGRRPKKVVHRANAISVLHNVMDADSSQIEAIETAKSGVSFVLQGPPGTGKSQTITNIIAEFLSDGKKVLFVSEKQAALNVVYNSLYKANLADFCLELHSHKANKKSVINELSRTLQLSKSGVSSAANRELEAKEEAQRKLNDYERELHLKRPLIEKSLYELLEEYSALRDVIDVNWPIENIDEKGQDYIEKVESLLKKYIDISNQIGYDYRTSPWYGFVRPILTIQDGRQIGKEIETAKVFLENLTPLIEELDEKFNVSCSSLDDVNNWVERFKSLTLLSPSYMALFNPDEFAKISATVDRLEGLAKRIKSEQNVIDQVFDRNFYSINGKEWNAKLRQNFASGLKRMTSREYRNMQSTLSNSRNDKKKLSYEETIEATDKLVEYQNLLDQYIQMEGPVRNALGRFYTGIDTDWEALRKELNRIRDLQSKMNTSYLSKLTPEQFENQKKQFTDMVQRLESVLDKGQEEYEHVTGYFDSDVFDFKAASNEKAIKKLQECIDNNDTLVEWGRLRQLQEDLEGTDLMAYLNYALDNNMPISMLIDAYRKQFYEQWIHEIIMSSPILYRFDRDEHERTIATFAEKDKIQFEINKAKIRAELLSTFPSREVMSAGSQISILEREAQKKRRQKSIRTLLSEIGELAQTLKPVFLMSPQSVSTFLNPESIHFDVVIFDEASQVFPQDALGAIYRGDQLIVVGDSKQMPPTNFFMSRIESDDYDEETEDIGDFESILDICSVSMRRLRLRWHYRSRYEQLIAFSNKNFYNNDLITFPSASADKKWIGVDYHYVDGVLENGTNIEEARYVVDLIYENIDRFPERSLGVVAFNSKQEALIEQLLNERRQRTPEKEYFFRTDVKDPFFIKNLETVQGDERDTIIFSVLYAKNPQGVLHHRFGPLSQIGGERRLNVAITRAKSNVQLVTSLHHTDLDLTRISYEGPRLLKEYLDYAENGSIAFQRSLTVNPYEVTESPFEAEVLDYLKSQGFDVDTQVGCSGFRIDLGLKRPDTSDYVLAIECDGASYHSTKNARDRDRLRQQVLENMGWNFYRIWSTDWFKNNAIEKQRLKAAAIDALKNAGVEWPYKKPEPEGAEPREVFHYETDKIEQAEPYIPDAVEVTDEYDDTPADETFTQEAEVVSNVSEPEVVAAQTATETVKKQSPIFRDDYIPYRKPTVTVEPTSSSEPEAPTPAVEPTLAVSSGESASKPETAEGGVSQEPPKPRRISRKALERNEPLSPVGEQKTEVTVDEVTPSPAWQEPLQTQQREEAVIEAEEPVFTGSAVETAARPMVQETVETEQLQQQPKQERPAVDVRVSKVKPVQEEAVITETAMGPKNEPRQEPPIQSIEVETEDFRGQSPVQAEAEVSKATTPQETWRPATEKAEVTESVQNEKPVEPAPSARVVYPETPHSQNTEVEVIETATLSEESAKENPAKPQSKPSIKTEPYRGQIFRPKPATPKIEESPEKASKEAKPSKTEEQREKNVAQAAVEETFVQEPKEKPKRFKIPKERVTFTPKQEQEPKEEKTETETKVTEKTETIISEEPEKESNTGQVTPEAPTASTERDDVIILGGPVGIPFSLLPETAQSIIELNEAQKKEIAEIIGMPAIIDEPQVAIMVIKDTQKALLDLSAIDSLELFAPKEEQETAVEESAEPTVSEEAVTRESVEETPVGPELKETATAQVLEPESVLEVEEPTIEEPVGTKAEEQPTEEAVEVTASEVKPEETVESELEELTPEGTSPEETVGIVAEGTNPTETVEAELEEPMPRETVEAVPEGISPEETVGIVAEATGPTEAIEAVTEEPLFQSKAEAKEPEEAERFTDESVNLPEMEEVPVSEQSTPIGEEESIVSEGPELTEEQIVYAETSDLQGPEDQYEERAMEHSIREEIPIETIEVTPVEVSAQNESPLSQYSSKPERTTANILSDAIDVLVDMFVDTLLDKLERESKVAPTKKPLFNKNDSEETKEALKMKSKNTIASLFSQVAESAPKEVDETKATIPLDEELEFPTYTMADIKEIIANNPGKNFQEFVKEVLEVEAPLSEDWLLKRCLTVFGGDTVTKEFKKKYLLFMRDCERNHIVREDDGFLYLDDGLDYNTVQFRSVGEEGRSLDMISTVELAAGMLELLKWEYSMDKEKLYRTILNECGFVRLTKPVYLKFESALKLLKDEVNVDGNKISIK